MNQAPNRSDKIGKALGSSIRGSRRSDRRARLRLAITALALVIAIAAVTAGCSGSESSGEKDSEKVATEDGEKGSVTITTDAGKTVLSSEWPKSFPDEIPKPKGMKVTASSQSDAGNITIAIETKKPFDEVVKLYQEYVESAGYAQTLDMKENGYHMYSGTRGNEMFMFTFSLDQEDGQIVTGALVYEIKG